ncbi:hypothetical protein SteCoe_13706 [Stentor coeruleus]|uniref:UBC core domain-containing protein n=1 Tax=Stentor coeruleus TaxID=5963 RepID=A0A1R2C7T9_9CILI|nr:hypothetical protein SteCoe_13706 [Stentor coeruleus]
MIIFKTKRESEHPLLSVASLRLKKDLDELSTRRFSANHANTSISTPYLEGIYIYIPIQFHIKPFNNSLYSNAVFSTSIKVSPGYPFKPPEIYVLNQVYHPNINIDTGAVNMKILQSQYWKGNFTINDIMHSFEILINEPDLVCIPDNEINKEMVNLYISDYKEFCCRVKMTMDGGVFYERYTFEYNYGQAFKRRRIRNEPCGCAKRSRLYEEYQEIRAQIEMKNE